MSSRFVKSKATQAKLIHVEIMDGPKYAAVMNANAAAVLAAAVAVAPVHTGYYKRKLRRRGARVMATDPFGHLVEWGSANNPPYAPLRRGVLAAGLRLDEAPPK